MDKYKIVFVFHSENLQSGATRSLMDIVDYLIQTKRYTIVGIFPKAAGSAVDFFQKKGVETYYFKYGGLMQNLFHPLWKRVVKFPFLCIRMLKIKNEAKKAYRQFRNEKIDLVYSNTSSIVFGGFLGRYLKCKQAWHIREFRKLDHRIDFFLGDRWLQKFINRNSDVVFFVSESVRDIHMDIIDNKKMYVTYNSYPKTFIRPRVTFNKTDSLHLLVAGDIKPSKGQMDCLQAVLILKQNYPEYSFVLHLAGKKSDEEYYQRVVDLVESKELKGQVVLHGQVNDMISLRDKMDVGIVSSTYEAFGRTTIEGMLSMMAMIGRNSGGTLEQIDEGKTGLLYDGSCEDLAAKLAYLYENRDEIERMAKAGFEVSVELHTKGRCAKIVDDALRCVLNTDS